MMRKIGLTTLSVACGIILSFQSVQKSDLKASIKRGADIYVAQCLSCHQEKGEGIDDVYPPVAKSDYLMADKKRSIVEMLNGVNGEMKVKGKVYSGEMSSFAHLSDEEISDVLNYVRNSWGNKGAPITPAEVRALRK